MTGYTISSSSLIAVSRRTAAALFDVSPSTFDRWVNEGSMPQPIVIGGVARWLVSKLKAAFMEHPERPGRSVPPLSRDEDDGDNPFDDTIG